MRVWLALLAALTLAACSEVEEKADQVAAVDQGPTQIIRTALTPWPEATEVRMFVQDQPLSDDGQYGMSRPQGVALSDRQRGDLASAMSKVERRGAIERDEALQAACFIPHHFFRYFDASGKQIGEIAVCYCCGNAEATPALVNDVARTSFEADLDKIDDIIVELGFPVDVNC